MAFFQRFDAADDVGVLPRTARLLLVFVVELGQPRRRLRDS